MIKMLLFYGIGLFCWLKSKLSFLFVNNSIGFILLWNLHWNKCSIMQQHNNSNRSYNAFKFYNWTRLGGFQSMMKKQRIKEICVFFKDWFIFV